MKTVRTLWNSIQASNSPGFVVCRCLPVSSSLFWGKPSLPMKDLWVVGEVCRSIGEIEELSSKKPPGQLSTYRRHRVWLFSWTCIEMPFIFLEGQNVSGSMTDKTKPAGCIHARRTQADSSNQPTSGFLGEQHLRRSIPDINDLRTWRRRRRWSSTLRGHPTSTRPCQWWRPASPAAAATWPRPRRDLLVTFGGRASPRSPSQIDIFRLLIRTGFIFPCLNGNRIATGEHFRVIPSRDATRLEDITGEVPFMKTSADRYDAKAREAKARLRSERILGARSGSLGLG